MTSHLAIEAALGGREATRFKSVLRRVEDRKGTRDCQLLSLASAGHLYPRTADSDRQRASDENIARCLLVEPGDLVVNPMWLTGGSIAVSDREGAVSPDYRVFRPTAEIWPRFIHHLLRSSPYLDQYRLYTRADTTFDRRVQQDDLDELPIPVLSVPQQRRIADFLDGQVARINNISAARSDQQDALDGIVADAAYNTLRGSSVSSERKPSGLRWLGSIPERWLMATVHAGYSVQLGKMLDESRFTGAHAMPYLRNTNVQWDRITTDDLKVMDIEPAERERFTVRAGDLLICEGGQPGRSAVWDGSIAEIAYQKALHRARPRGSNDVRWLQTFLRVAVQQEVFSREFGQATIGHLTGEQLRSLRLPMPSPAEQRVLADRLARDLAEVESGRRLLADSIAKLGELKRSLITAAVTGEFDVSSADGSRVVS